MYITKDDIDLRQFPEGTSVNDLDALYIYYKCWNWVYIRNRSGGCEVRFWVPSRYPGTYTWSIPEYNLPAGEVIERTLACIVSARMDGFI